jgi:hypothetical protein
VQGLYDALLATMKNGRTLGESRRFRQLEPVIWRTFDIPTMVRLSVGPYWANLTEARPRGHGKEGQRKFVHDPRWRELDLNFKFCTE